MCQLSRPVDASADPRQCRPFTHTHPAPHLPTTDMAALTTCSVTAVSAVRGSRAAFGNRAALAAPARATASKSRASLAVQAATRDLWCVSEGKRGVYAALKCGGSGKITEGYMRKCQHWVSNSPAIVGELRATREGARPSASAGVVQKSTIKVFSTHPYLFYLGLVGRVGSDVWQREPAASKVVPDVSRVGKAEEQGRASPSGVCDWTVSSAASRDPRCLYISLFIYPTNSRERRRRYKNNANLTPQGSL